ncbi:pentatricopeptide repeat-containing protein At2g37320 [Typha latifolia]|uniref:pentatricopeptide repeat-containing protein At2g37320 n=1 Tax=Typha latifolia TaxID=4733 RepID=UPI003C2BC42B
MYNLLLRVSTKRYSIVSKFCTFTLFGRSRKLESNGVDNALRVLDLMIPRKGKEREEDLRHHRLINDCMHDILDGRLNSPKFDRKITPCKLNNQIQVVAELDNARLVKEDAFLLFVELHKRGISADEYIISSVMSSSAEMGDLSKGLQFHALSVKIGYELSIPVGSSLISLYSRCGQLEKAYQVFEMMPMKNTVSWTAIIAGYAQNGQVEICLNLFVLMRQSMLKPNDFTFASLLSVCTSGASLGLGRSVHGLEIRVGFASYVHVSNALISMYAKCGSIDEAQYIFEKMPSRDLISWNSMIFGYAQYGLAEQAVKLLKEMDIKSVTPDKISFLGVLSSCRHAGLVEEGRHCFDLMLEYGITPELDHYCCIIDLLGRAGLLNEALDFIERMPTPPNAVIWGSLLSSCRVHGNSWIGIHAAESRLSLEPGCAATYVQLANLYASVGYWHHVARVRKVMKEKGLKTSPGYSWIEVGNRVYRFKAEDRSNTQVNKILSILDCLQCHMDHIRYAPIDYSDFKGNIECISG